MNLKNFMMVSLFFICKNNNGMNSNNKNFTAIKKGTEEIYFTSSESDSESKSKSKKTIIYSEGREQDLAMELEFSSKEESQKEESQMQEEKPHSGLFNEQRVNINKQLEYQNLGVKDETNKIKDALKMINKEDVERYLVEKHIITNNLTHAVTAKEILWGGNNKAKRGLVDNMVLLCYGDERGCITGKDYDIFKKRVMDYAFEIYDGWVANKRSVFLEKLLIHEEENNIQAENSVDNNLINHNKEIIKVALAWLGMKRDIENIVKNVCEKVSGEKIKDIFWNNVRQVGIKENRINKVLLKKKLEYILRYDVCIKRKSQKKEKVIKSNYLKEPIFRLALKFLYATIQSPIFFDCADKLLQGSDFSPASSIKRRKVIEQHRREVPFGKGNNKFIISNTYRKLAEELLLPNEDHIKKNNQNDQTHEMHESADEGSERVGSEDEREKSEDSFCTVVNNCLNEEKPSLIVKQQQGEEEPVFQSEASEGEASKDGNYDFFEESSQQIGGMVMPKSVEEDSEEEKRNQ